MNEKEKVYAELDNLRKRVFELRKQVRSLNRALSEPEIRRLRAEHHRMTQALSLIAYSPSPKYDDIEEVRVVAAAALTPTKRGGRAAARQFAQAKRKLIAQAKEAKTNGAAATDGDAARPLSGCPDGAEGSTPSRSVRYVEGL